MINFVDFCIIYRFFRIVKYKSLGYNFHPRNPLNLKPRNSLLGLILFQWDGNEAKEFSMDRLPTTD
jgi:hypothetical protein